MTNNINKKYLIITLISLVVVIMLIASLCVAFDQEGDVITINEASADTTNLNVGFNGVVKSGYVSPYASKSGAIRISSAEELTAFVNTANASGTADNKVYGYLACDITYSDANFTASMFKYAYLDGCGYTITYNCAKSTESGASIFSQGTNYYMDMSYFSHYSSNNTPFGYCSKYSGFFAGGLLGSYGYNCEVINTNFKYSGKWKASFCSSGNYLNRPVSLGVVFGYAYAAIIDNCSLTFTSGSYIEFNYQNSNNGGDYDGLGTLIVGGYAGVWDGYNTETELKNSKVTMESKSYIRGVAQGVKWATIGRLSPRVFIGGFAGTLCNNALMYNISAAGSGYIIADVQQPSYNSGKDRLGFSGIIVGTNCTQDNDLYAMHTQTSGCTAGTIDGVISSWSGCACVEIGEEYSSKYNGIASGQYIYGGILAGFSSTGSFANVYITVSKSDLETQCSANSPTNLASPIQGKSDYNPFTDGSCSYSGLLINGVQGAAGANFIDRYIYSETANSFEKIGDSTQDVVNLVWANTTQKANVLIFGDSTKLSGYTVDSGYFVWSMSITGTGFTEVNKSLYNEAKNVADAINNYKIYAPDTAIPRGSATDLSLTAKVTFGRAVYYEFNESGFGTATSFDFGSKTYDATSGITPPSIILKTSNGSSKVGLNYTGSKSEISKSGSNTLLTDTSIWTVYNAGNFEVHSIDYIKDAGDYELAVYNGDANSKFDFLNENLHLVAYRTDNSYYKDEYKGTATKWQPLYTYTVNQKEVTGAWATLTNNVDNESYTTPQDFTYCGQNINFAYTYSSGLVGSDVGYVVNNYYTITYTKVAASRLLNNVEYYQKNNDGTYSSIGYTTDANFPTLEEYYRKNENTTSNISNAGTYKIVVNKTLSNENYKISDSVQTEWTIEVSPRTLSVLFRNMDEYEYNKQEQQATWIVATTKDSSATVHSKFNDSTTMINANIVVYNVFESTAVNVTYDSSNDYESVGNYYVYISLASGSSSKNYLLPSVEDSSNYTSEEGETISKVVNTTETDGVITKITRIVTIHKAGTRLVREYAQGSFTENERGTKYEAYDNLTSLYSSVTIDFKGESQSGYYESEIYNGYNSLACVLKGVTEEDGTFDQIYCEFAYYPATIESGVYMVSSETTSSAIVSKTGLYVVVITFNQIAYSNYAETTYYMVYNVEKLTATITVNSEGLDTSTTYTGKDVIENLTGFASVSGLTKTDIKRNYGVSYTYYVKNNSYEGENYKMVGEDKYEQVDSIIERGEYLAVVNNNINTDNYEIVYTNDSSLTKTNDGYPYVAFEVKPMVITINVTTEPQKVYGEEYVGKLNFSVVSGEIVSKDDAEITLTSDGIAASANAGLYDIVGSTTGANKDNYTIVVENGTDKFVVSTRELVFVVSDYEKVYGTELDTSSITYSIKAGYTVYGEDDVYPVISTEASSAEAIVGTYSVTAESAGTSKDNYVISIEGNVIVTAKVLTLSSITPADNLVYSGREKKATVVFDGIVNNDEVNAVILYNETAELLPINVGDYSARVTGVDNANYTYTANTVADLTFEITKRDVSVIVENMTMGFGDTKIVPNSGLGFSYSTNSLEFATDANLTYVYTAPSLDSSASVGSYTGVVIMTLSGDDADNYNLTIEQNGNLEITIKDLQYMTLATSSTTYTGENLMEMIKPDTNAATTEWSMAVYSTNEFVYGETASLTEVVNAGTYYVYITATEGSAVFESNVTLQFTVNKAAFDTTKLDATDLELHYNKVVVKGDFVSYTLYTGLDSENLTEGDTVSNLTAMKSYTIYVKVLESDNYLESSVMSIAFTTTFDPTSVNSELDKLAKSFGFKDITTYKTVIANIENVSEKDESLIDSTKLETVKSNYKKLTSSAKSAVTSARDVASKTAQTSLKVKVASTSAISLAVAGLMVGLKKKKDKVVK